MSEGKAEKKVREPFEPKEEMVFELMKEIFAFGYNATERLEERAEDFAKMRRERMDEFRRERERTGTQMKGTFEERTDEFRSRIRREVQNVLGEMGVATKSDIDEIKKLIADLALKEDLSREEPGKEAPGGGGKI